MKFRNLREHGGHVRYMLRVALLRIRGAHIGNDVEIRRNVFVDSPDKLFIGDNTFINRGCEFHIGGGKNSRHKVMIGKNVFIGMNVCFICIGHRIGDSKQRAADNVYYDIVIGDGCWIGANATILQNVNIGSGAVIAAGAMVCKSVNSNIMAGGVPAKQIKVLKE